MLICVPDGRDVDRVDAALGRCWVLIITWRCARMLGRPLAIDSSLRCLGVYAELWSALGPLRSRRCAIWVGGDLG